MHMKQFLALIFMLVIVTAFNGTRSDGPATLINVLNNYFQGIATKNRAMLDSNCTRDYILFEHGAIWNNDSLWAVMQSEPAISIRFKLDNFKTTIDTKTGHISYHNEGRFYRNDTLMQTIHWVESAAFLKENGRWKIHFLHSTRRGQ